MSFFKSSTANNSCKGAKDFAASFSCAEKTTNNIALFSDIAIAVSVLLYVIICAIFGISIIIPIIIIAIIIMAIKNKMQSPRLYG